jgi:hypothetical protein
MLHASALHTAELLVDYYALVEYADQFHHRMDWYYQLHHHFEGYKNEI